MPLEIHEEVTLVEFESANRDERGVLLFKAVQTVATKLESHVEEDGARITKLEESKKGDKVLQGKAAFAGGMVSVGMLYMGSALRKLFWGD